MNCTGVSTDFTAVGFVSTAYFIMNPITNLRDQPVTFIYV